MDAFTLLIILFLAFALVVCNFSCTVGVNHWAQENYEYILSQIIVMEVCVDLDGNNYTYLAAYDGVKKQTDIIRQTKTLEKPTVGNRAELISTLLKNQTD